MTVLSTYVAAGMVELVIATLVPLTALGQVMPSRLLK